MSATATGGVVARHDGDWSRLTKFYPHAITDLYGSGTPCIFKTGPKWPLAPANSPNLLRAARPIYEHPIQPTWLKTAWAIVDLLDSLQVQWNAIDPLAYANAGEQALICEFVVIIGVQPASLAYAAAVAAADAVRKILEDAGFPNIQVAFIESVYRSLGSGSGPKLMNTNWLDLEGIAGLRKPFTPTLGLAIAPLKAPHFEGSGGLFFRLSSDEADKRIALLTCAHVSRPPPLFENDAYTRENDCGPREDVLLLGYGAFDQAVGAIVEFIGDQTITISDCESALSKFPGRVESEVNEITMKRNELVGLINAAKARIPQADELHSYATKNFTTTQSRVFGFVLHSAKIESDEDGFLCDWSLIQLDDEKIDKGGFKGNVLFVGGNKTAVDWKHYMCPQADGFRAPEDMLLPLKDYVPEAHFRDPRDLDVYNTKTLLAVKNGRTTGTTFGRVNGLESITRMHRKDGGSQTALQFAVCNYDAPRSDRAKFSDDGDSGAFVVGRDGRVIGQLTGGGGPKDEADRSYITPYYALKKAIDRQFPGCRLLDLDS